MRLLAPLGAGNCVVTGCLLAEESILFYYETMSLRPKLARQIVPAPGDSVLSSRYVEAITRQSGSIYDDCVSSASAIGGHGDFLIFSNLLTRLCTQKAARMTTQRDASAGRSQYKALMTRMESLHESLRDTRCQWDAHYLAEERRQPQRGEATNQQGNRRRPTGQAQQPRDDQQRGDRQLPSQNERPRDD